MTSNLQSTGLWIAGMVLGYVIWWPVGLAINMYMVVAGKFNCLKKTNYMDMNMFNFNNTTGNTAFDSYKEETMRRLEEEQKDFNSYLERLRLAKDQREFDQFMQETKGK